VTLVPLSVVHAPGHAPGEVTLVFEDGKLPTALVGAGTTLEHLQVALNARLELQAAAACAQEADEPAPSPACAHRWAHLDPEAPAAPSRVREALGGWARWWSAPVSLEARLACAALGLLGLGALIGRLAS